MAIGEIVVKSGAGDVRSSTVEVIGGTPVVHLGRLVPSGGAEVLVKLEYFSPTGSYKDRMALAMIDGAERRGKLRPGMSVVEFTGGSTGSSLAFVCAVKGYPLKLVSSDAFSPEKLRTMRAFGAELTIVPSRDGMITPTSSTGCGRSSRRWQLKTASTGLINSTIPTHSTARPASAANCLPKPAPPSAPSAAGLG